MITVKINDIEFLTRPNISVLEACKYAGINIPRFCYHEILSVSGNCRMCLVEVENLEKPIASCVTEVEEGMSIWVDTPFVKKARENVVEALLLNHPLDCPICDQAGECDLQDQTKAFGGSYSRFFFKKKVVEDKYCGPLIKTIMTRCISCTRCVRYASEVAGLDYFGTLNRGVDTEIGSYVSKMFESEISGNVIDLCPVGALTSKPYAFKARPWELRMCESIDVTDSLGSNIYINYKETEILRILPKSNININDSIISDKARFFYDSNTENRISKIYQYCSKKKKHINIKWSEFFINIDNLQKDNKFNFYVDEKCDLETLVFLKEIVNKYPNKINLIAVNQNSSDKNNIYVSNYLNIINKIEQINDLLVLLGCNPKLESAVLNSRIRFKYKNVLFDIKVLGMTFDYNIPANFINLSFPTIIKTIEAKNILLSKIFINSTKPCILIGENLFDRTSNKKQFLNKLSQIFPSSNIINITNNRNSDGLTWLNCKNGNTKQASIALFTNVNDNISVRKLLTKFNKKVWINTHGSLSAAKSDFILPMLTPFESEEIYLNIEHRPQKTQVASSSFSEVKQLKNIVSSIFNINFSNKKENYLTFLMEILNNADKYESIKNQKSFLHLINKNLQKFQSHVTLNKYPIKQKIKNFYCVDNLTKNSAIMQECSDEITKISTNFYKN